MLFEFVNNLLLYHVEKRTTGSATDMFIMESLWKFEHIDLPSIMMEHMYKSVIEHKSKHYMGYG